ncbi:Glyoxalase-like domain protein [compost metagenome]
MIKGIQDFYYNVENMDRAVGFYTKAFGMKVEHSAGGFWTSLSLNGVALLGLHWTEGEKVPATPRDSHGQACGGTLTFTSDNIAEDRKHLESLGAKILGEANEHWGHMLVFEDLDGNVLKLMKPAHG